MALLAAVLIVLGVGLVGITVTTESMRRRRLAAFFAGDELPRHRDLLASGLRRLPLDRNARRGARGAGLGAVVVIAVTGSTLIGVLLAIIVMAIPLIRQARARRREELLLRSQMADALASIASAMASGSSFVRALHELSREVRPPLAGELDLVLNEIDIGVTPADAFRSMAERTELAPAEWLAHLLRVQETTGAPLVTLLKGLADHVKQGDGIQREVQALTAEGRMSAYVIAGLPLALVVMLEISDPDYLDIYTSGWGIVASVGMVLSVVAGLFLVTRMVNSLEV